MNKKIYGLTMGALALGFMASCSNEVKNEPVTPDSTLPGMELAKAPDLVISSNNVGLAGNADLLGGSREGTLKYENDEVEINLAINNIHTLPNGEPKYDVEDLVSHLSIHVRSNTDVNVTLPVPAKYYCDQDDLYIYNDRSEGFKYEGSINKATYTLKAGAKYKVMELNADKNVKEEVEKTTKEDIVVTLNIEFLAAVEADDNTATEGGIRVWTDGITKELIDYCRWTYGDGINFDAFNYYNRANQYTTGSYAAWTLAGMKEALDLSTIEFTNDTEGYKGPDYYINAFTGDKVKGTEVLRDCTVAPIAEQAVWFYLPTKDQYSDNMVYVNKRFPGIDDGSQETGNE